MIAARLFTKALAVGTRGGWGTYAILAMVAAACGAFLGLTVQARGTENLYREHDVFMPWLEQGYFYLGGQRWVDGAVKNTYSWFYLFPAFIIQKINYLLTGAFSYRLMALYNQLIVALSALSVGFLGFHTARLLKATRLESLVYATCALLAFQTFPWNVAGYFRIYPTNFWMIFAPLLMVLVLREIRAPAVIPQRRNTLLMGVLAFILFYTEHIASLFLFSSLVLLTFFLSPSLFRYLKPVRRILLPGLLGIGLFLSALVYLNLAFPDIAWRGSTLLYRTGLDGSTALYGSHADLLTRTSYIPSYLSFGKSPQNLSNWHLLASLGAGAFVFAFLMLAFTKSTDLRQRLKGFFLTNGALALQYGLFAGFLTQAAVTHPFGYDLYLAAPLIIALFTALPALLSVPFRQSRLVPPIVLVGALYLCMSQLRAFALAFPIG